jgi:hypothetical protein
MDELAWPLPPTAAEHISQSWKWRGGIVKCNSGNGRLVRFITVEISPPERVPIILTTFRSMAARRLNQHPVGLTVPCCRLVQRRLMAPRPLCCDSSQLNLTSRSPLNYDAWGGPSPVWGRLGRVPIPHRDPSRFRRGAEALLRYLAGLSDRRPSASKARKWS